MLTVLERHTVCRIPSAGAATEPSPASRAKVRKLSGSVRPAGLEPATPDLEGRLGTVRLHPLMYENPYSIGGPRASVFASDRVRAVR
jgi:hypothetical protein